MNLTSNIIQFQLPESLACPQPTEVRNIKRDQVRLLVTESSGAVNHTHFYNLDQFFNTGDVLIVNTSATRASALDISLPDGKKGKLHFSTKTGENQWLVEIRLINGNKTERWYDGQIGMEFKLPEGGRLLLTEKFYKSRALLHLWVAEFHTVETNEGYLSKYASPIKYDKLDKPYPLSYYQTVFAEEAGSSEMPSAGRGFTRELLLKLEAKGVKIVPVLLHTGVSSLEENEPPYSEYMTISTESANTINEAKAKGHRIIATGTTALRAIESAVNEKGNVQAYKGYTDLYIEEDTKLKVINGLITGFHEPAASHLKMLQSLAGYDHIEKAYQLAINHQYYWHQFGDLHLILA